MVIENKLLKYIVSQDATIEEAWSIIEENRQRSVIVVKDKKVVGTLSDGDLRKAMLSGRLMSTPVKEVMNINFFSITKDKIKNGKKIFKKKAFSLIPIVDENMNLLNILANTDRFDLE